MCRRSKSRRKIGLHEEVKSNRTKRGEGNRKRMEEE